VIYPVNALPFWQNGTAFPVNEMAARRSTLRR
jgi:hypothetical protein